MILIKEMSSEHIGQVAELEGLCFADPWSEKSIASELENPLAKWLVALDGERVVGYVGSQTVMDETDMMNLAVHADHRRQGIGESLIQALVILLKENGSRQLTLEVRSSNHAARELYGKMGFTQAGLRRNYYANPKEDALILRKEWDI